MPQPDQYFHPSHYHSVIPQSPNAFPNGANIRSTPSNSLPPTPSADSIAGRKRSRSDIYSPEDEHEDVSGPAPVEVSPVYRGEPVYGPGMTLVYPNDHSGHYAVDASSQSGTWLEERADSVVAKTQRPIMASRKSQRMAPSSSRSDIPILRQEDSTQRTATAEPLIDEVTRLLGISWIRMDGSEALQISQKAYTRWITRHYPGLADVELWFENASIPGYLGVASNKTSSAREFFLWSNDLKQAVLVTRNPAELVAKLSQPQSIISSAALSMFANTEAIPETCSVSGTSPPPSSPAVSEEVAMEVD